MEYDILTAVSSFDLRAKVRAAIEQGWQPLGGVAIGDNLFAQAMTRPPSVRWNLTPTITGNLSGVVNLTETTEKVLAR